MPKAARGRSRSSPTRKFFQGGADDLRKARRAADLPVLRKDFVIDEYQLWEARVMLADAALLIVRILEPGQLREYIDMAHELGLATLVEVHGERELERALDARAPIVGINNRDLDTFTVSIETTARLRGLIPPGVVTVSESGIASPDNMSLLKALKIDAALIGEELLKAPTPPPGCASFEESPMAVRGIRGAARAAANSREEIFRSTQEVLRAIVEANRVRPDTVGAALFTMTPDLTAGSPRTPPAPSGGRTCR